MDSEFYEKNWIVIADVFGYFRVTIPATWYVNQSESAFTLRIHEHVWNGHCYSTNMSQPLIRDNRARRIAVGIRIEQFTETPPTMKGDVPHLPSFEALRAYRILHDSDWLTCVEKPLRIHIQYGIQYLIPGHRPSGWEASPPLAAEERQQRLWAMERILKSLELLTPDR